nr:MAG TPA: hypothetical protein [Caudoviricetes sp.]DAU20897.1 MAG TPA: hypothetical protein [Caudoviricetes sp.]
MHPSASVRLNLLYSIKKTDVFSVSIVVTLSRLNLA